MKIAIADHAGFFLKQPIGDVRHKALAWNPEESQLTRRQNDAKVIALAAKLPMLPPHSSLPGFFSKRRLKAVAGTSGGSAKLHDWNNNYD